ncbi:MAG: 50S ribosomal protein L5 [Phycisphaerales bacterium]|nr:50S ribosomal protein L5 [Phycisphaerales bacterium]
MAKDTIKPKKVKHEADAEASGPLAAPRLRELYATKVREGVAEKFGLKNPMQQPRLTSIVINVNMGRHLEGTKLPPNVKQTVLDTLTKISGQKPVVLKAKKSVSNFKVRAGYETAAMVTLRRDRMWYFLDRLINLATPRIKDFRGLNDKAFDRQGNFAIGLTEQGVFPEIDMAAVTFTHGMNINLVFSNSTPDLSRYVLAELGMPFRKDETKPGKSAAVKAA